MSIRSFSLRSHHPISPDTELERPSPVTLRLQIRKKESRHGLSVLHLPDKLPVSRAANQLSWLPKYLSTNEHKVSISEEVPPGQSIDLTYFSPVP